jgi:hypothetical protein
MAKEKDSKWFRHDGDALEDPKIMMLVTQFGWEGFGLYWMLIQRLVLQPDYTLPVFLIDSISRLAGVSAEKIEAIITKFGLFKVENDAFFSPSLIRRMEIFEIRKEINTQNAKKRWALEKQKQIPQNAISMQSQCNGSTNRNAYNIIEDNIIKDNIIKDKKKTGKEILNSESENDSEYSSSFQDILKLYDWIIKGTLKGTKEKVFPEKVLPKTKREKDAWIKCISDLLNKDGYSLQEINRSIIYARENTFWNGNFLSLLKLRRKDKEGVKYIDKFLLGYEKENNKISMNGNTTPEAIEKQIKEAMGINQRETEPGQVINKPLP